MPKVKVTLSLDAQVVAAVDEQVKNGQGSSRSALIEEVLREWQWREMERQIEEYYLTMTDEEREEDRRWAEFSAQQLRHVWSEGEDKWQSRAVGKSTTSKSRASRTRARRSSSR